MAKQSLEAQYECLAQETRMVLPGIQALFGFQLIACFNQAFKTLLSQPIQNLHLTALMCTVLATLSMMAPASYHRLAEPGEVSPTLIKYTSRFTTFGMIPLALSIALDVYVVSYAITNSKKCAWISTAFTFLFYVFVWFVFPLNKRK